MLRANTHNMFFKFFTLRPCLFIMLTRLLPHLLLCLLLLPSLIQARMVTDAMGRVVEVPDHVDRVIGSGSGCLRLLTFLQAIDVVVAVDDIETKRRTFDARPYALAHPELKELPVFGQFRGHDNPELILSLSPQPQVIFKTASTAGHDPVELQTKTGIPVIVLDYGDLASKRQQFYDSLRLIGTVLQRQERAEAVITFFETTIADLQQRSLIGATEQRPSVYLGGVAYRGPHGFTSTEPTYPPFRFVNAFNRAAGDDQEAHLPAHSTVAKEQVVAWDPDILFLDLSTLQMGDQAGGLYELKNDPAYRTLTAVRHGKVYGVLPYNWYTTNYGSLLANSYFIGTLLHPEGFADIDPRQKADEIYHFLVGKPVFAEMDRFFGNLAYRPVPLTDN